MQFLRGKRLNSGFAHVSVLKYLNLEHHLSIRLVVFVLFHRYTHLVYAREEDYNASPNPKHLKA
jgi:hypothetical protein